MNPRSVAMVVVLLFVSLAVTAECKEVCLDAKCDDSDDKCCAGGKSYSPPPLLIISFISTLTYATNFWLVTETRFTFGSYT